MTDSLIIQNLQAKIESLEKRLWLLEHPGEPAEINIELCRSMVAQGKIKEWNALARADRMRKRGNHGERKAAN